MRLTHKEDQHDDRDHIGDHGNQLRGYAGGAEDHLEAGAKTEQQTAQHGALGLEFSEDHRRDGDEALTHNGDGTELVGNGHGHAGAAQAGQEAGNAHAQEPGAQHVDAQRFAGLGMFTAGTHPQTEAGLVKDEPDDRRGNKHQVGGGVVGKRIFEETTPNGGGVESAAEQQGDLRGGGQGNGVRGIKEGVGHHDGDARCQQIDGGTGDGLVRAQADGGGGMEGTEQSACQAAAEEADPGIAGKVGHHAAGESAGSHHALDSDVHNAGHFREAGTQRGKQQRGREQQGSVNNYTQFIDKIIHSGSSSFPDSTGFTGVTGLSFFRFLR